MAEHVNGTTPPIDNPLLDVPITHESEPVEHGPGRFDLSLCSAEKSRADDGNWSEHGSSKGLAKPPPLRIGAASRAAWRSNGSRKVVYNRK
jgi:hypothetical protein